MANRACSTIRGITILGNSVCGLDFLNWCKVYNALVIPSLTYGAPVWYTGRNQKGLIQCLQVAQNEGICKITGVFQMTPVEPLHNLTGIPPISYVLPKLIQSYSNRLTGMTLDAKVRKVLTNNWCQYWPMYMIPLTNLRRISPHPNHSTYRPLDPCTAGQAWTHDQVTYNSDPSPNAIKTYSISLSRAQSSEVHVVISPYTHNAAPVAIYHIYTGTHCALQGCTKGIDQIQALCRAVEDALPKAFTIPADSLILWMRPKTVIDRLLTFHSHRDTHITYDTHALISTHLATNPTYLIEICTFRKAWTGFPSKTDMKLMSMALDRVLTDYPQPSDLTPKQVMWRHISTDYSPSPRRSHIACTPPVGNRPPPAICAAIRSHNCQLTSAIFQFATGHMFDADYSDRFRPNAPDNCICPCELTPRNLPHQPPHHYLHTANHVLF